MPHAKALKLQKICREIFQTLGFASFGQAPACEFISPTGALFTCETTPWGLRLQLKLEFPRKAKGAFLVFLNQFTQDEGQKAWLSLEERKFFLQLDLIASDLDPVLIRQKVSRYLWLTAGLLAGGNLIPPVQEIALHAQLCPACLAVLEKATLHQQHQRMVEEAEDEIFKADKPKCGPPDPDFWELPPF